MIFDLDHTPTDCAFPDTRLAEVEPNGLLAVGGDLREARLLNAYRHGIFPWYSAGQPILWWSPTPRMVLFPAEFRMSRSLRRTLRNRGYQLSVDQEFDAVIQGCAAPREAAAGTWLVTPMIRAYQGLHRAGHAHSIEVWHDQELVGGLYGMAIGRAFFGESMFSRRTDASKCALALLVDLARRQPFSLIDCQVYTPHLASLGAREIDRRDFEQALQQAVDEASAPLQPIVLFRCKVAAMTDRTGNKPLPLYLSAPHTCSYLPDRLSSTLFTDPEQAMDSARYAELLGFGFRRSGRMVYTPRCENCHQCVSVRVPVADFRPRRWQRRVLRANQDVELVARPASFDREHYALYQRYTAARHGDGEMASATPADYMAFLRAEWCDTRFIELRSGGRLLAVAVTDVLDIGLSAVYTFFDPAEQARSLGTFAILQQIAHARDLGLPHHYLGYWIRDSRKMAYKTRFRPLELWREGAWQRIEAGDESVPT